MADSKPTYRILIVDDNADVLDVIGELLRTGGHDIRGATNGKAALEIVRNESIDLVIVDLMMPGMDGWHLLQEIKTYDSAMPVIVLTGFITEQGESILTNQQADGYLIKPVEHRRLQAMILSLLAKQPTTPSGHIVIVEDDATTRLLVEHTLIRRGLKVTAFTNIAEAQVHIINTLPDLVIIDIILSDTNGFDLCQILHDTPETLHIPILILTAQPSRQNLMQAIRLRVRGFLAKPVSPNDLIDRISKILRRPI